MINTEIRRRRRRASHHYSQRHFSHVVVPSSLPPPVQIKSLLIGFTNALTIHNTNHLAVITIFAIIERGCG